MTVTTSANSPAADTPGGGHVKSPADQRLRQKQRRTADGERQDDLQHRLQRQPPSRPQSMFITGKEDTCQTRPESPRVVACHVDLAALGALARLEIDSFWVEFFAQDSQFLLGDAFRGP